MADSGLDVLRPSDDAKKELSKIFESCRNQAGCSNWGQFTRLMLEEVGLEVSKTHFEVITSGLYKYLKPAPIFAIHGWGSVRIFRFPNGEIVNASTLGDVVLSRRNANGDLIQQG